MSEMLRCVLHTQTCQKDSYWHTPQGRQVPKSSLLQSAASKQIKWKIEMKENLWTEETSTPLDEPQPAMVQ